MNIQDRYSFNTWPTQPLPSVLLRTWPNAYLDGDWIYAFDHDSGGLVPDEIAVPLEIHLRQFASTNPTEPNSLLELVRQVGLPLDEGHYDRGVIKGAVLPDLRQGLYQLAISSAAKAIGLPTPDLKSRPNYQAVHVSEAAARVVIVGQLVAFTNAVLNGDPVEAVAQELNWLDFTEAEYVADPFLANATGEQAAWMMFAEYLNRGLESLSPRLLPPTYAYDNETRADSFTAACIAIFNDLVENAPYRRCEDEKCGRLFKNQLGRARTSARRSDARYCTPQHAINQAQRERRRREREAKNGQ